MCQTAILDNGICISWGTLILRYTRDCRKVDRREIFILVQAPEIDNSPTSVYMYSFGIYY